ncbi:flagellar biosynthetic protein FliO [Tautonia sp. JC769]|uniref:flagellar biosynthetic protein FliO n=1 Tax=Tautonia sp. JC769 TaxID=3232135 RepID=UPI0034597F76
MMMQGVFNRDWPGRLAPPSLVVLIVLLLSPTLPARDATDSPPAAPAAEGLRGRGGRGVESGTVALALTALLAVVGVGIVLGNRLKPAGASGVLRVVGRAHLTGRHVVYLLRAGDRTLILGVGPQGAPSLLGELDPSPSPPDPTLAGDPSREDRK